MKDLIVIYPVDGLTTRGRVIVRIYEREFATQLVQKVDIVISYGMVLLSVLVHP